jgi:hypothetical protein
MIRASINIKYKSQDLTEAKTFDLTADFVVWS